MFALSNRVSRSSLKEKTEKRHFHNSIDLSAHSCTIWPRNKSRDSTSRKSTTVKHYQSLALFFVQAMPNTNPNTKPLNFAIVGDISLGKGCRNSCSALYGYKQQITRIKRLIKHLNRSKPEFVIFLGNIVHTNTSDKRQKLVHRLQKEFEKLKITYYVLPGEKDLASQNDTSEFVQSVQQFKQDFNTTDRFVFYKNGIQYIGLTSEYWAANAEKLMNGQISDTKIPNLPEFTEQTEFLQTHLDKKYSNEGDMILKRVLFVNKGFVGNKPPTQSLARTVFGQNQEDTHKNSIYDIIKRMTTSELPINNVFCASGQSGSKVDWKVQIGDEIFENACVLTSHRIKKINAGSKFSSVMGTSATYHNCEVMENGSFKSYVIRLK